MMKKHLLLGFERIVYMAKVDIISGFLGAGKTTLIKKLLKESLSTEKVVLVENEFGEIGIDGGFLRDAGIEIQEMNSGCICCTLSGDFTKSIKEVVRRFSPNRILIEPSGVGKLSDVIKACERAAEADELNLNMCISVVDATKYRIYVKNFAEFFTNQIEYAKTIVLSRTQKMQAEKLREVVLDIQKRNPAAIVMTTPWEELTGERIVAAAESDTANSLAEQVAASTQQPHKHGLHCACDHDHEKQDDHPHGCACGHAHGTDGASCGEHHHAADEVFGTWGVETPRLFSKARIQEALNSLSMNSEYGNVLRAKGIVPVENGEWVQFDYVPGETELRPCAPDYTGRLCVIGEALCAERLCALFEV